MCCTNAINTREVVTYSVTVIFLIYFVWGHLTDVIIPYPLPFVSQSVLKTVAQSYLQVKCCMLRQAC